MKNVQVNIKIDTGNGVKTLNNLKVGFEEVYGEIRPLTTQLGELEDILYQMAAAGQQGTNAFKEIQKEVANSKKIVQETDKVIDAMSQTLGNKLGLAASGLAGAFGAAQGAVAIFGVESDAVAQTLVKLQSAMAIQQGLASFKESLPVLKQFGASITAAATSFFGLTAAKEADAVATGVATTATNGLSTAMKAIPIVALVAGVAALVTAIVAVTSAMGDEETQQEKLVRLQKAYREELTETAKGYADERAELAKNLAIAKDETQSKQNREKAIKNINAISPEYLGNIKLETINTKEAKEAIDTYITSLDKKAKAQAYSNLLTKQYEELVEIETKSAQEFVGFWDMAGNTIKAQWEELSKGNLGALTAADMETLQNATERNFKRGEVLRKKEREAKLADIQLTLDMIAADTKAGEVTVELNDDAQKIADDAAKKAEERAQKRKESSQELANELKKLQETEQTDLAESEDKKNQILLEREKERLQNIYNASQKTKQDLSNLNAALLKLDEKYLRDKNALIKKANEDAAKQAEANAQQTRNEELAELQAGYDDAEKLMKTEQQNEENAVTDHYFRLKTIAEKNGEDVKVFKEAERIALSKIRDKYRKEELEKEEEANERLLQSVKDTSTSITSVFTSSLTGSFDEINKAFANLTSSLFDPDDGLITKLKDGTITATDAILIGIQTITDVLTEFSQKKLEEQLENNQELYDRDAEGLKNLLAQRIITQEEYDAKLKELQNKKDAEDLKAKRKAFEQSKKIALINATIQTAQAVLAAYSSGVAYPFIGPATGAVYAGIAAELGAVQIGVIASQKFQAARGGVVPSNGGPSNIDSVDALLAPNEMVINANSARMFPQLLSSINQAGGGVSLAPETSFVNRATNSNNNTFSQGNNGNQPARAYIVYNDLKNGSDKGERLSRRGTFGR